METTTVLINTIPSWKCGGIIFSVPTYKHFSYKVTDNKYTEKILYVPSTSGCLHSSFD